MKRFPVKSLIRFRSVCKAWKSLIDSSGFIARYRGQQQHLLVRYGDDVNYEDKYVSVVVDDTFPHLKVSVTVLPLVVSKRYTTIVTSHGLLCFFAYHLQKAVIWNPEISKVVDVILPDMADVDMHPVLGFWVCRKTTDPKIVKITHTKQMESVISWQVEVFTLSTRAWRSLSTSNLPRNSISFYDSQVVVDEVLYWLASDRAGNGFYNLIVSFDLTSEEFGEVNLPDNLANFYCSLSMYKLRESLVMVEVCLEDYKLVHRVWMMEDGDPKTFEKLYTISNHSPDVSIVCVRGFWKTGELLVELLTHPGSTRILATYDPYSKSIRNVGIDGRYFSVCSYMETLLLL